ncbi:MAG: hypothetical protein GX564_10735, partial [Oligosphaeraceae bacterium]|nr:hypothetical protein [Oligosphaeraceae bacterium]
MICAFSFPKHDLPGPWPVTFGLPLEQGRARDAGALFLQDALGAALPLQVKVNARWPDGSLKWILLDSVISAGGEYSLHHQPERGQVSSSAAIAQVRADGLLLLATGGIRLEVPASGALWRYWQGDDEGQADLRLLLQTEPPGPTQEENWLVPAGADKATREYGSAGDGERQVLLEENGPVRATVKISGWFTAADG